jgi:gamma-glutamylaminecyclotransferase
MRCGSLVLFAVAPFDAEESAMKLLVYGTLRRGGWNHSRLGPSHFLGEDSFTGSLWWNHEGGIPFAKTDGEDVVHGELFEVPSTFIPGLDALEGHPVWYKRTSVKLHKNGGECIVYIYQGSVEGMQKVPEGRYPIYKPSNAGTSEPTASAASSTQP